MLFDYPNEFEGGTYLDWVHVVAKEVINHKINRVLIDRDDDCLGRLDKKRNLTNVTGYEMESKTKHRRRSVA